MSTLIKLLKFGTLSIEFGESISSKYYEIGKHFGKLGDSSVILIKYENNYYLVDTGFANEVDTSQKNLDFNKKSLKYLFELNNLQFEDISGIFITHWHADHFGNLRCFPNARLYSFFPEKSSNDQFINKLNFNSLKNHFKQLFEIFANQYHFEHLLPVIPLNENDKFAGCKLLPTPGHTRLHCSLITELISTKIVIAGDAIVSQSYYDHNEVWSYNSGNLGDEACKKAMNNIIKIADYIIPGHGFPFQNYKKVNKEKIKNDLID